MHHETTERHRIQLRINIIDNDGQVLSSYFFNLRQRRETERSSNHFGLAGTEHVSDRFSIRT